MARRQTLELASVLQFAVGVFLVTLGVLGVQRYNSELSELGRAFSRLFGQSRGGEAFNLAMGILEIVAGVIVVAGLFVAMRGRVLYVLTLIIVAVWIVAIIFAFFVNRIFEPDFLSWLNRLSLYVVVLIALWMINRRYAV